MRKTITQNGPTIWKQYVRGTENNKIPKQIFGAPGE